MAQCQVTVTVTDENDHAPVISITNVASTSVDNGKRSRYTRDVTISGEFGPKINTHAAHTGGAILQHGAKMHTSECAALLWSWLVIVTGGERNGRGLVGL